MADQDIIDELKRSVSRQYFDENPMPNLNPEAIDFRVTSGFFSKKRQLKNKELEFACGGAGFKDLANLMH